jgi:hypothetical protein
MKGLVVDWLRGAMKVEVAVTVFCAVRADVSGRGAESQVSLSVSLLLPFGENKSEEGKRGDEGRGCGGSSD